MFCPVPVDSCHPLPVRVKSPLVHPRELLFKSFLLHPMLSCQIQKGQFRRVPQPAFPDGCVIAQSTGFQKKTVIVNIQFLLLHKTAVYKTFLHCHPVFGKSACLIRAHGIDCSQCFHGWKPPDNGSHLHHPGYAKGQHNRDDCR